jgi:DNA-binding XRE family transcriptional regulator
MGKNNKLKNLPAKRRSQVHAELCSISDHLQRRRKAMGYTQEELAEKLEIAPKTLQSIEQKARFPSLPLLIHICQVLDIKLIG